MFAYYVRLALRGFRRNPGLTALMIAAIALGIAVCVMTLTVYHAMAGNPIWWKNDVLYAVTFDSWDPERPYNDEHPELAPTLLTYRDASAVYASGVASRTAIMFTAGGVTTTGEPGSKAQRTAVRVTSGDFFPMFDVPFKYGNGWSAAADRGPEPVIVISSRLNQSLFAGADSVGRTVRWDDREFRVIGVLDAWLPLPRFYDVSTGAFEEPEDAYVPWGWGEAAEISNTGNTNCWKPEQINSFREFLGSECVWTMLWVELPDAAARERMQAWLDGYGRQQKQAGRFQRPLNNRLTKVDQWLADNDVVSNDNRVLVGLAFAFLVVCLLNTVGLLLAKFLGNAAVTGVRRALGASRRQVFLQHLTEVGVIAFTGGVLGLGLGALLLRGLRALYDTGTQTAGGYQALAHADATSVIAALALALVATIAAGLYPAWRIGRVAPAIYLKSQ